MAKCGGLTETKPAISEVQEICDLVTIYISWRFLSFQYLHCCAVCTIESILLLYHMIISSYLIFNIILSISSFLTFNGSPFITSARRYSNPSCLLVCKQVSYCRFVNTVTKCSGRWVALRTGGVAPGRGCLLQQFELYFVQEILSCLLQHHNFGTTLSTPSSGLCNW